MMNVVNTYFDHVYVINLQKRSDRRAVMEERLARHNIEYTFFNAVDGNSPEIKHRFLQYQDAPIGGKGAHPLEIKYGRKLLRSPGAYGYLMTYIGILEDALENGYERILCFDDDVIFHNDFNKSLNTFMQTIPDDWKLLFLGATQHVWNYPVSFAYPDSTSTGYDPEKPYYLPKITDGSFAIGIDRSIFNELISSAGKFNAPFDSGPLRDIMRKYEGKCIVAQPNLVIADVTESDIGNRRDQVVLAEKLKWDLALYPHERRYTLVSVVIPVFNSVNTIEKCVRSIMNQSYKHIEIIIADDASTDGTIEVVKRLMQEDFRIKLIENTENRGCYFVRNDAIRQARGKLIAFQDADDISLRNRLERQIQPILLGNALFTASRIYRTRCKIEEFELSNEPATLELVNHRRIKNENGNYEYRDRAILGFVTSVFDRRLFEELGLFWEKRFAADAEFCERILCYKLGRRLEDGENIHSLLMDCDPIPGLFQRIDEVLYLCSDMDNKNITNQFKKEQKLQFEKEWREKFKGNSDYQYPTLDNHNTIEPLSEIEILKYQLLTLREQLKNTGVENSDSVSASRERVRKLEEEIAWYSRTYDHLPKWYLKAGSIFRRIKMTK